MFHSLTGCDTVLFLAGRGKKAVTDIWNSYEDLTEAFLQVMNHPGTEINECFAIIEHNLGERKCSTANAIFTQKQNS